MLELRLIVRIAHILAAATWVGGSILYLVVVLPALRAGGGAAAAQVAALFRRLVNICMGVLLLSGAFMVFDRLTQTTLGLPYLVVLSLKIVSALAMFIVAIYLGQRNIRRLAKPSTRFSKAAPQFMLSLGIFVFLLGALLYVLLEATIAPLVASAKRSTLTVTFFLLVAASALIISFLIHDFGVSYVQQESNLAMPWYFTLSAFYGGQEGSLLYWALILSIFSAIFIFTSKRAPQALVPYVMAALMSIEVFFLIMLAIVSNPFVRLPVAPPDGRGLNPLLMDPGMLVHPPMLLMGYMSFSLPFAFAVAALITGKLNSDWLRSIRRWMLVAWSIQTTGLLLGAWWAYHVLGWGGYWGWDPVENAALLPWLTATAFLHSTMVQERRGMLKVWNLALVIASFALSIFGTFEVRSGVISSVHSFAYSSIGNYFLVFLVLIILSSIALFFFRLPKLQAEQEFDSVVSREGVFLLNNLLLVGIAFATLWGTLFPLISSALNHQTMTVGAPFYERVIAPLMAVLIL